MRPLALLGVLLVALPTALAAWQPSLVDQEPNSSFDHPGVMWPFPNASPAPLVYFEVHQVAASASNLVPHLEARLVAWVDCNGDGIMGDATGETYSSFLLFSGFLCPPGTRHNDGAIVREALAIGPGLPYPHYDDPFALVWADGTLHGAGAPPYKQSAHDVFALDPAGPIWAGSTIVVAAPVTAYAYVSDPAIQKYGFVLPGPPLVYGAEQCAFIGPGAFPSPAGWDCDPLNWVGGVVVGQEYRLRDTDCLTTC